MVWGKQNVTPVLLGAWLQGIGSLLSVIFVFALVHLANAATWFSGSITKLAATIILAISLTEMMFYFSAVYGGLNNDLTTVSASLILLKAVQHLYFIAPPILLPLGIVVLSSRVLPKVFGYLALGIGVVFALAGLVFIFIDILNVLNFIPGLFAPWVLGAAIALMFNTKEASEAEALQRQASGAAHRPEHTSS